MVEDVPIVQGSHRFSLNPELVGGEHGPPWE